jgi:hypothetical protein
MCNAGWEVRGEGSLCFLLLHPTWLTCPGGTTVAFCNAFPLTLINSYYFPYYKEKKRGALAQVTQA